ncbi:hypothetical protein B0T14DRAFT_486171 [Immersiella caudata]|uniref:GAR domain-containing protein n=1 Tax=Immersiella caudata TaxID=314043 RepID=A0AA40BUG7_9PEZI|nr:hypothetical protein B0T14DRAFT_486171 [Immersiella caudata]
MAEPPTPISSAHLAPRGRQLRTASDSPTRQRGVDDLLSNLTPRTAVEAFRNPSGSLKECMDCATPTEQAFALKAAIASTNIQEWLEELSSWPWPKGAGPAGFEAPSAKSKRSSGGVGEPDTPDTKYCGSLLAADVARYEIRMDEISRAMDDLDVEEIKSQVLHNHIMPLSRPGSPMLDSKRTVTSPLTAYTLMDDLTALITATLLQALPNLSRLTRLMNAWSIRLLVLRKITVYLNSLEDAEVAVQSGWNAIGSSSQLDHRDGSPNGVSPVGPSTLSRKEFDVMKSILERKVAKAGRDLDVILDMLEGLDDTLPEGWIDRMDTLEQQYSEWTVACERKIREADWAKTMRDMVGAAPVTTPIVEERTRESGNAAPTNPMGVPPLSLASLPKPLGEDNLDDAAPLPGRTDGAEAGKPILNLYDGAHAYEDQTRGQTPEAEVDDSDVGEWPALTDSFQSSLGGGDYDESVIVHRRADSDSDDTSELDIPEPDLPTLPRSRRDSDISNPSTIVHGLQSELMDFSSDQLEHGTPEIPRVRDADLGTIPSDELSPDNSPPDFRSSTRSVSVSFNDMPTVAEIPDDDSSGPRTPLGSSFAIDDDVSRDLGSPGKASTTSSDDHLQQQISEILEGVPAKIRLTSEPAAINLNPPDFTMPTRKAPKPDLYPRSQSSLSTVSNLSSRAGTPSFTLAPAYNRNSRQRHQQRGNQEIKLYHLSRSNGEAPIKLFIRCVGEHNERVMVRVGGGWADLGEYLKEYASHHGRRSGHSKVEIKDLPSIARAASTPPTRPTSAQDTYSPITPLNVRKSRRSAAAEEATVNMLGASGQPKTPLARSIKPDTPSPEGSTRSRSSSRVSWPEEDSSLGMAGPKAKQIEMSEESKAWVESVKEKVRMASGERKVSESSAPQLMGGKFGEMGKVGATKRLFRRQG